MNNTKSRCIEQKNPRSLKPHTYTMHACKRMSQRNIKESDVRVAMQYGEEIHRTGIVFFFLGRKNLPNIMQEILDYLEGTTVLYDPESAEIITVYRNPEGLRDIKRKAKYAYTQTIASPALEELVPARTPCSPTESAT